MAAGDERPGEPTAVVFLGDASPFGLSVAAAAIRSCLVVRAVLTGAPRSVRTEAAPRPALVGRIRRHVERTLHPAVPDELVATGEPIPPLVPDPRATATALRSTCDERGIPWRSIGSLRSEETLRSIEALAPDVILSAAFPRILPPRVLGTARLAAVNVHPSLLPRCRGSHPIFWTLADAEPVAGVTAHLMTGRVDAGPIVTSVPLPLAPADDYRSLYRRTMEAAPGVVTELARALSTRSASPVPQDDARATFHREDTDEDRRVKWDGTAAAIEALSRTCQAWTWARGEVVGLVGARALGTSPSLSRPGTLLAIEDGALVAAAAGGSVAVPRLGWRGRIFPAETLARAMGLAPGTTLG
jgi:methionyl-tRNA formyltransferase